MNVPQLMIAGPTFYSSQDEASFFSWLESIPGVSSVTGVGRSLEVNLNSVQLNEDALREMLALHRRYQLPMRNLAIFLSPANESWFAAPEMYWHDAVFGVSA
ncbi:hypothetical protein ACS5PN_15725 [Roseateles sp. NT4]|uniref:hypothetical protein n=1 Tax=Roseateles sp. NT4 TaxID=3453715 RepID=UPI003EEFCEF9